jgi:Arc/MetJ-type ribon-helix-helix transcriptional regulator
MLACQDEEGWAMTIHLPDDLEHFLRAEVHRGHFASEEEAIAEAVRLLRHQLSQTAKTTPGTDAVSSASTSDPLLGALRDAADELDEIVAEAMKHREQQLWRLSYPFPRSRGL